LWLFISFIFPYSKLCISNFCLRSSLIISAPAASQADYSSSTSVASAYLHGSSSSAPATVQQRITVCLQQKSSTCRVLSLRFQHFIFLCCIQGRKQGGKQGPGPPLTHFNFVSLLGNEIWGEVIYFILKSGH
jgi:hypothetical protein